MNRVPAAATATVLENVYVSRSLTYYVQLIGQGDAAWALREHGAPADLPAIDHFRSEPAARHAGRLLHAGLARIEPHRPPGCRIQPIYVPRHQSAA